MKYYPLPLEYTEALDCNGAFILTIVGKDPYPQDAVGIPFCKPSWDSMSSKRTSGFYVLQSIGLNIEKARSRFRFPMDCFLYLAKEKAIAFLNLSYHRINGSISKKHSMELQSAENINQKYLFQSRCTVLCGEAKKIFLYKRTYPNLHEAVHPDIRCKHHMNPKVKNSWIEWWSQDALKNKIQIHV